MSAKQRAEAEALRAKYARCFRVPTEQVVVEFLEDEDACVYHGADNRLPRWHLGTADAVDVATGRERSATRSRGVMPRRNSRS